MITLIEQEYYYRPTPDDADASFDPVMWGEEKEAKFDKLSDVFDIMKIFVNLHDSVELSADSHSIFLNSGSDSEEISHPDHYFTPRYQLRVIFDNE